MKYIILESQMNDVFYEFFEYIFDKNDINWTHPYDYDDMDNEYEDVNRVWFYKGDYDGPFDSDFIFQWYDKEYFNDSGGEFEHINYRNKKNSPILEIREDMANSLTRFLSDSWREPFKIWFKENFGFSVKTIIIGLS